MQNINRTEVLGCMVVEIHLIRALIWCNGNGNIMVILGSQYEELQLSKSPWCDIWFNVKALMLLWSEYGELLSSGSPWLYGCRSYRVNVNALMLLESEYGELQPSESP